MLNRNRGNQLSELETTGQTTDPKTPKIPIRMTELPFLKFARVGNGVTAYLYGFNEKFVEKAKELSADFLVFANRPWKGENSRLPLNDQISVAVLDIDNYENWFASLGKQTRRMIRKSAEDGIKTHCLEKPSKIFAEGIYRLFKESPIREGRYFEGYHIWNTKRILKEFKTSHYMFSILATFEDQIVGVTRVVFHEQAAVVQTLLSSLKNRKTVRGVTNSLMSATVEELSRRGIRHLIYGKMGHLSGLDFFRLSNGFKPVKVSYNYLPLSGKGRLFAKLGMYRPRDLLFSTKLRTVAETAEGLQKYVPIPVIKRLHLYV